MNLTSIFTGVPQSRYAGLAVLLAIVVVSISILFGKESMPLSQKIGAILLLLSSCKKETPASGSCNIKFYTRIECVQSTGDTTYSPISYINIK